MEKNVLDIESGKLDIVEAEFANIRQSTIRAVEGGHIELQQVAALSIDGDRVEVTQGAAVLMKGESLTLNQSVSMFAASTTANINFSCTPVSVSRGDSTVNRSAVGVLVANEIRAENSTSILLIGRKVQGNITTLLDWRSAAAIGAVAGGIFGLFTLFRRR
ncbi:MAG TPA: hypothetical protein VLH56_07970 [Dissulfurispiraceae bacterium]|nr:hypothetical protein [Dissulfurispiraceae bacterium]